jgi:hypothetical protein
MDMNTKIGKPIYSTIEYSRSEMPNWFGTSQVRVVGAI